MDFNFAKKAIKHSIKYILKLEFFHYQMIRTCMSISNPKDCLTMPHPSQKPR